jgi:hypothetical protein
MTIASSSPTTYNTLEPLMAWQAAAFESLTQAQNFQLQWLSAWQRTFPVTQELWDQWVAHFGGGVPLDA